MDRAETLRQALRKQEHAHRKLQAARTEASAPEESAELRSTRMQELQDAAAEADAEMARLRPEPVGPETGSESEYQPPIGPAFSN
jgi:tryptophan 2,3-dioxygenase